MASHKSRIYVSMKHSRQMNVVLEAWMVSISTADRECLLATLFLAVAVPLEACILKQGTVSI